MSVTRREMLVGAAAALVSAPALGQEANWPQRALRIIIPAEAAVRRLIRTVDSHRDALFTLAHADIAACRPDLPPQVELASLATRMAEIDARIDIRTADSPLSGLELMERLGIPAGPLVGKLKNALTDAVVSGELTEGDKGAAEALARAMIG